MRERIRELESEVQHLQVRPAAEVRARGRRRGRRQLAAISVAGAVVAIAVGLAVARSSQQSPTPTVAAPPEVACVLTLPKSTADVRVRVLDGGAPAGLAEAVATRLRERSYTVQGSGPGTAAPSPAALSYGPAAIGAAALLKAQLAGNPIMAFDATRDGDTIDLTIGPGFAGRLASPTELNQALATAGEPSAPPQCTSVSKAG